MRDWNSGNRWVLWCRVACFQHTYEGLKPSNWNGNVPVEHTFSAYLWGIETQFSGNTGLYVGRVFSIPMRDWNNQILKGHIMLRRRFQHTYEGLKLAIGVWDGQTTNSFQHTYEGLKLLQTFQETEFQHCFQHTYEGLKLPMPGAVRSRRGIVFSIPMRDWNNRNCGKKRPRKRVFSIPMRDWNDPHFNVIVGPSDGFQHTYEGLKLSWPPAVA